MAVRLFGELLPLFHFRRLFLPAFFVLTGIQVDKRRTLIRARKMLEESDWRPLICAA
jgi:hypothetical protein